MSADPAARASLRARLGAGPCVRALARLDLRLYRLLRHRAHVAAITPAVTAFSRTGEHAAVWLALGAAGALADPARRSRWVRGATCVAGTYALNTAIKGVVRRHRPSLEDLPALIATPTKLSFPSAHASSSFAAATAYAPLLPRSPLHAVAGLMALSRVYLGVHYPSDIAAGAALGTLIGRLTR